MMTQATVAERRLAFCSLGGMLYALGGCTCSSKATAHDDARPAVSMVDNMVAVPAGWFSAGCYRLLANVKTPDVDDQSHQSDESRMRDCVTADPPRRLWISSFEIDRFEVTIGEYQRCLDARACERPASRELLKLGKSENPDPRIPTLVPYDDAVAFCQWRHKRLPTDAEWQKAARGTDDRIYPWGDARPTCKHVSEANWDHDGLDMHCDDFRLHPVGLYRAGASPYGAEDLEDNAAEWVKDWWPPSGPAELHDPPRAFSRDMSGPDPVLVYDWSSTQVRWRNPAVVDPQGPPEYVSKLTHGISFHATKGGGFPGISGRQFGTPGDATQRMYAGFRCVRTIPGPPPPAVQAPTADQFMLPFREPGYTPPGTPATETKTAPKGKTP